MVQGTNKWAGGAIVAGAGAPAIAAVGVSLVVREWTGAGPSWLHIHRSDDEAWHVLGGIAAVPVCRSAGRRSRRATVFAPAGAAHTY